MIKQITFFSYSAYALQVLLTDFNSILNFKGTLLMIIFRPKAEKYYIYERKPSNFGGIVGEKSLNPQN